MKSFFCLFIAILILLSSVARSSADDNLRILIQEDSGVPASSTDVKDVIKIDGKVFINGKAYTGNFGIKKEPGGIRVISSMPIEKYVEGVVASEAGSGWEIEALKAQAVAARTYALFHKAENGGKEFDLTSGTLHQLYNPENSDSIVALAVSQTRGEILTFDGVPIESFYHSVCYGSTELPEEVWGMSYPYLKPVECRSGKTAYENWQRRFTPGEMENALNIPSIKEMKVSSYTATGRVKSLEISAGTEDSAASYIKAVDLRRLLGYKNLPSTDFSLTTENGDFIFNGRGWGHGVGMSQWGALEMAKEGKGYREILEHYYPGAVIENEKNASADKQAAGSGS
ncbi:MAG: SpoIID/LytB domain-containing protein [Nitrospirae bacterium]|nr:SpoIID/LytB domain-containing protein [Nitrospirota bacterium]